MIDLHKVILRNGLLGIGFSASFSCLDGNEALIESWVWDAFTAVFIKPANDTGAGSNDKVETISAEKWNLFLQEMILPDLTEIRGYKSDLKSILTLVQ